MDQQSKAWAENHHALGRETPLFGIIETPYRIVKAEKKQTSENASVASH
jgi:hypothetical protein